MICYLYNEQKIIMKKILLTISLLTLGQSFAYNRITIMNETDNYDIYGYVYANTSACNDEKVSPFEIYSYESQSFTGRRFFNIPNSQTSVTYNGITYYNHTEIDNAFSRGELSFTKINFKISSHIGYLNEINYGDAIRIPSVHNNCDINLPNSFTNNVLHEGSFTIGTSGEMCR